ncbi:MAG: hypothetical protein J6386_17990 [Candidatus Synoicihabitans palmerolidicus]|nr:hypothetical protein [Candidatus Synoicihabitans palmerolidicus]
MTANQITLERGRTVAFRLTDLQFDYHSPLSWKITSATAERIEVALTYPTAVDFSHHSDDKSPREATLTITTHGDGFRF